MHDVCCGLHIKLEKFRRRKWNFDTEDFEVADFRHFSFVQSIYPVGVEELQGPVRLARARYPLFRKEGDYATTLTLTNSSRKNINERLNKRHAPASAYFVPYNGIVESAQSMFVWPGIILQSGVTVNNKHLKLQNALRYKVLSVAVDTTEVIRVDDEGKEHPPLCVMQTSTLSHQMRLTYAITYDSSQARTLHGGVRLTQTSHPRMTLRRLIVGLGRAPNGEDVEVE